MPLTLDVDDGVLAVQVGDQTVPVDLYLAHERYAAGWQKYAAEREKAGELPLVSEFVPVWAAKVTGIAGWSGQSALKLWEAVEEEIEKAKKPEPA